MDAVLYLGIRESTGTVRQQGLSDVYVQRLAGREGYYSRQGVRDMRNGEVK